ncbi:MAG: hypothetical protein ACR2N7_03025, partial [Acidimicrobiia bacterium]
MKTITFLQLRPSDEVHEIWASTRRKEGTLAVEVKVPSEKDVVNAQKGGLLLVSGDADTPAPAYVVGAQNVGDLRKGAVEGWRTTVVDSGDAMEVLDAIAFTRAAFLRTPRSSVARSASLLDLPGLDTSVSTFVDSVADAEEAVAEGATDLLLRGWDSESVGQLRDALVPGRLVERTVY